MSNSPCLDQCGTAVIICIRFVTKKSCSAQAKLVLSHVYVESFISADIIFSLAHWFHAYSPYIQRSLCTQLECCYAYNGFEVVACHGLLPR